MSTLLHTQKKRTFTKISAFFEEFMAKPPMGTKSFLKPLEQIFALIRIDKAILEQHQNELTELKQQLSELNERVTAKEQSFLAQVDEFVEANQ
ncbi:hypothetical protein [Vibrio sp. CyArs1]|uniref:hypothetical protein n=1 Tax=Vibrio sp. CyArs1 TaxID=2682577 RepID=UPI001F05466E|nr:hypothetical protein [Vibrio sp. CyArs1]